MGDIVSAETRSRMMAGIRSKNTRPEMALRRGLHALGFRYRLHARDLPGQPDLVFPGRRAVIFVHGCFWHGHDCNLFRQPRTRADFWQKKLSRNREVDAAASAALATSGWRQATVWECALRGPGRLGLDQVLERCAAWLVSHEGMLELRGSDRNAAGVAI